MDNNGQNCQDIPCAARVVHDSVKTLPSKMKVIHPRVPSYLVHPPPPPRRIRLDNSTAKSSTVKCNKDTLAEGYLAEEEAPSSSSNLGAEISSTTETDVQHIEPQVASPLQINEVTSSDDESTPPPLPQRPPGGHGAVHKKRVLCRELQDLQNNANSMISGKISHCHIPNIT